MGNKSSDKSESWARIWRPSKSWYLLWMPFGAVLAVVVGALAVMGFNAGLTYSNTNEFCYGCHVGMDTVVEEYEASSHFNNRKGVSPDCADCHVPKEFLPKMKVKTIALLNLYHQFVGTYNLDNFEDHRLPLAEIVWADLLATNSRECRNCHNPEQWDRLAQPARARTNHDPALWERTGETCIDCHYGIAHKRPTIE